MIQVCFVCLGNICWSPTAEGIMIKLVREAGLETAITIDSAGTESWHAGKGADPRSQATANNRGVQLPSRSRQFQSSDFEKFDYVVAMDASNLSNLAAIAPGSKAPDTLSMLREFDPNNPGAFDVPDPYYGGPNGFETVYDLCESSCQGLLAQIRSEHGLS